MKIVLLTEVDKLGSTGDVVTVKNGYARNLLIPAGMALKMTPQNMKLIEASRIEKEVRVLREVKTHHAMAARLAKTELTIKMQVGEEDKMFGAVTSADIAAALADQDLEIDRRIIDLSEPIKSLGVYNIPVKLHASVIARVKLNIVKDE